MNTKATLVYGDFKLELEGNQDFVADQLQNWRSTMPQPSAPHATKPAANDQAEKPEVGADKPRRQASKNVGPSCAERIRTLIDEKFFEQPRKADEVGTRLREKATPYEGKHIAAALIYVVQSGKLRRVKAEGTWSYVNP